MTRLSAGTETATDSDGVGTGLGVGVGTCDGVGVGCFGVGVGAGVDVSGGVEAGSVEHANRTKILGKLAISKVRIRIDFILPIQRWQPFRAPSQSRKLLPVRLRNTSSRVVESGSPTRDLRPRGVSRAISLPLSMIPMRSQRRSASSM